MRTGSRKTTVAAGIWRTALFAAALVMVGSTGCSRIRLPAIDPTGSRLFAPLPTTTTFALPGSAAGQGLRRPRGINFPIFRLPEPAFPEPAAPPKCIVPAPGTPVGSGVASDEPIVPAPECNGQCKDGPPPVLLGEEINNPKYLRLPTKGKRGCILLSPQRIVAPVGGEVILLSGICGVDGHLQMGQPLEWMLTPDSVGTLIEVGDDDPGFAHRLARIKRAKKEDPSFARGVTSTKRTLITRGNLDPRDDVQLEKGQTWISISSPSEGTSHLTVLAPENECWDNRKATATIYWIDAKATLPAPQILPAGTPAQLKTHVTRSDETLPARGWKVRYEILQPELATFGGSPVAVVEVGDTGDAIATLTPAQGTSGAATIDVQVIRPGGVNDNMPDLTIRRGQAFVTWSAPRLSIRAGAPPVATFNQPVEVAINVSNPGDQPATNVQVTMGIPKGVKAESVRDSFAQNLPNAVVWEIESIPPKTELDLFVNVTAQDPVELDFTARADGGLLAETKVRIDVFRPALTITVKPEKERYEAGTPVKFEIDIKNTGERPIENVQLRAIGDEGMIHQELGGREVTQDKKDGPLQPGQDWLAEVFYVPTGPGRRCVNFEATGSAGQKDQTQSCVIVINPIPQTPAMTVKLSGRDQLVAGDQTPALFKGVVTNTGKVTLTDVRVTMAYDPQLQPLAATQKGLTGARTDQFLFTWTIPMLEPGKAELLEGQFRPSAANPRSQIIMTARSSEGAADDDTFTFQINESSPSDVRPTPPLQPAPPSTGGNDLPSLPPVRDTPSIPPPIPGGGSGGSANTRPTPPAGTTPDPRPSTVPVTSERLLMTLTPRDNPVRVGDPIRYKLRVTNDSVTPDGDVEIRFPLPPEVSVTRIVQTLAPRAG